MDQQYMKKKAKSSAKSKDFFSFYFSTICL